MTPEVRLSPEAMEQLRGIRHPYVAAEILDIAYRDLRVPPRGGGLDGLLPLRTQAMWWRRAVLLRDLDDFLQFTVDDEHEDSCQACDYVMLYRPMTAEERIRFKLIGRPVLIVGVYANDDLMKHLHP